MRAQERQRPGFGPRGRREAGALIVSVRRDGAVRSVIRDDQSSGYPNGRPLVDNAPRGQRGLARLPTARSDARNKGRAAVDRAPCEERGETKATEDRSLETLRDAQYDRCEGSARERATAPYKETTNDGTAP
jgi:hypothetical protein